MTGRRAIVYTLLLMLGAAASCVGFLVLQTWGEDLANKVNLSNRQKAVTHEMMYSLSKLGHQDLDGDQLLLEEIQLLKSKWVNSQKAIVNGSDLFRVSADKSGEADEIVGRLSPLYVRLNEKLSTILAEGKGSADAETLAGLQEYAAVVNELTLQWGKEQEKLSALAWMLLMIISAVFLVTGIGGYFVFIRPYVKGSRLADSESRELEASVQRERNLRIRLMNDLSHQLRTPLSAILGNAELMLGWNLEGRQRESVKALIGSASNMMHVLDEVMDETAIQKGELEMNRHKFNLHECLEQVVEMLKPLTVSHHVSFSSLIAAQVPVWVVQDEKRLRQVLLNVASDVIRHSEGRKINLRLDFLNEAEGMMQFKVTLSGVDHQLLEIYQRLRDEHSSGALSRDLALRFVHELGGRIWTEENQEGRTISFTWIGEAVRSLATEPSRDLNGLKALVIEQDKNILKVLIRQLGTWGIQSTPFNSLELVEEILGNLQKFDFCIIDVDPPGGESLILAEKLARQTDGKLPIIALTSTSDSVVESRSPLLGAYLTKPVKQIRLFESITALLRIDESGILAQPAAGRSAAQMDQYALNVIIAQDNELHRAVAARTLHLLGHRYENAFSMEELREKMNEKHYDLILVGHDDRQWKGFRLGLGHRDKNSKDSTVVIGVTDASQSQLPAGFDDIVQGRFTGEKLEEKIRNWFEFD